MLFRVAARIMGNFSKGTSCPSVNSRSTWIWRSIGRPMGRRVATRFHRTSWKVQPMALSRRSYTRKWRNLPKRCLESGAQWWRTRSTVSSFLDSTFWSTRVARCGWSRWITTLLWRYVLPFWRGSCRTWYRTWWLLLWTPTFLLLRGSLTRKTAFSTRILSILSWFTIGGVIRRSSSTYKIAILSSRRSIMRSLEFERSVLF